MVRSRPVLIRSDNRLFPRERLLSRAPARPRRRVRAGISINLSLDRCMRRLATALPEGARVLLVGAGMQRHRLEGALRPDVRLVATDVEVTAEVDVFCDAHDLPFADASFDAVVSTAVLEHVADPYRAMAEIHRVLRSEGFLYSEVPFIQQVHEGAYDFTRFTMAGHRRLAAGFEEISSGVTAGPCTALAWSIEHLAIALCNGRARRSIKVLVRASLLWLVQLDRLIADRPASIDAASCTYFLGRRREDHVSDEEIVMKYSGAQQTSHR